MLQILSQKMNQLKLAKNNIAVLTTSELTEIFSDILDLKFSEQEIKDFLLTLNSLIFNNESPEVNTKVFLSCATALKARMKKIPLPKDSIAIDVCGTGGDQLHTLNISTAVSFVVAASGIAVAKHGNKAVSSKSGSFDVLAELRIPSLNSDVEVTQSLHENNLGFIFAPFFHPALASIRNIRKEIGTPTIFNFVAPVLNPAQPKFQIVGTSKKETMRPMAELLKSNGVERAYIFHGFDGMDEVSLCSETYWLKVDGQKISELTTIAPEQFGLQRAKIADLAGGDAKYNALKMIEMFRGDRAAYFDAVSLNAAFAFRLCSKVKSIEEGITLAANLIDSGQVMKLLNQMQKN